jgi:hypothetical protein
LNIGSSAFKGSVSQICGFARCEPGDGLNEIIQEAIPVSQDECDRLKRRYRLKSGTGLPGCIFKSRAATTVAAFKELMDSCCN